MQDPLHAGAAASSVLAQNGRSDTKRKPSQQPGPKHNMSQQRAQPSPQPPPPGKQGVKPGLNLQPTAAQKASSMRNGQSLTALRAKADQKARAARGLPAKPEKPAGPVKPKATKQCRNCKGDIPLKDFFCEKRLPDGLMHMCMKCASKKGLSGKPATPEVIAAIMKERHAAFSAAVAATPSGGNSRSPGAVHAPSRANGAGPGPSSMASQARGGQGQRRPDPGAQQRRGGPPMQAARSLKGFYGSQEAGPWARMAAAGGRRHREDLDQYEDDFVEQDEEEEDWRAQLREVCTLLAYSTPDLSH